MRTMWKVFQFPRLDAWYRVAPQAVGPWCDPKSKSDMECLGVPAMFTTTDLSTRRLDLIAGTSEKAELFNKDVWIALRSGRLIAPPPCSASESTAMPYHTPQPSPRLSVWESSSRMSGRVWVRLDLLAWEISSLLTGPAAPESLQVPSVLRRKEVETILMGRSCSSFITLLIKPDVTMRKLSK